MEIKEPVEYLEVTVTDYDYVLRDKTVWQETIFPQDTLVRHGDWDIVTRRTKGEPDRIREINLSYVMMRSYRTRTHRVPIKNATQESYRSDSNSRPEAETGSKTNERESA